MDLRTPCGAPDNYIRVQGFIAIEKNGISCASEDKKAGKAGFEPAMPAPKTRALTTWRLPSTFCETAVLNLMRMNFSAAPVFCLKEIHLFREPYRGLNRQCLDPALCCRKTTVSLCGRLTCFSFHV